MACCAPLPTSRGSPRQPLGRETTARSRRLTARRSRLCQSGEDHDFEQVAPDVRAPLKSWHSFSADVSATASHAESGTITGLLWDRHGSAGGYLSGRHRPPLKADAGSEPRRSPCWPGNMPASRRQGRAKKSLSAQSCRGRRTPTGGEGWRGRYPLNRLDQHNVPRGTWSHAAVILTPYTVPSVA